MEQYQDTRLDGQSVVDLKNHFDFLTKQLEEYHGVRGNPEARLNRRKLVISYFNDHPFLKEVLVVCPGGGKPYADTFFDQLDRNRFFADDMESFLRAFEFVIQERGETVS